jgi:hypothetical protein
VVVATLSDVSYKTKEAPMTLDGRRDKKSLGIET